MKNSEEVKDFYFSQQWAEYLHKLNLEGPTESISFWSDGTPHVTKEWHHVHHFRGQPFIEQIKSGKKPIGEFPDMVLVGTGTGKDVTYCVSKW